MARPEKSPLGPSLVAQSLDRIQVSGFERRNHAADESNDDQDAGGHHHNEGRNQQLDIRSIGMRGHGAVKGDASDTNGNSVRQGDTGHPADSRDHQRLGQKLDQNVPLARAQGFFDADLLGALLHRDQHDVHQPDTGDAQRQGADKQEQHLERDSHNLELRKLLLEIGHEDRLMIRRPKVVHRTQCVADRLLYRRMIPVVVEPEAVEIFRVFDIGHRAERDVDLAIYVALALLHLGLKHADDLEADAVQPDMLADGIHTSEQLSL